ncbi:MAG: F0F1 ATP synthase subunit A, partial [Planctomycetales bacterium]|nr:F0F1 ATP synthase subunit A [Planctomycetales bacterium]
HIKDSYYFEVPRALWSSHRESIGDFPSWWVRNDSDFQKWEAERLINELGGLGGDAPSDIALHDLVHDWEHWQHEAHLNHGRPLDVFLEMQNANAIAAWKAWQKQEGNAKKPIADYLDEADVPYEWFVRAMADPETAEKWQGAKREAGDLAAYEEHAEWSETKIEHYNELLQGKILIPQPFGELRNAYQRESGFAISKFMVIEVVVAVLVCVLFAWLAKRMASSDRPRGRLWNMLEAFLLFIRNDIARNAIGHHDGDKFTPVLWSLFFFILGCNLMGILPWLGAPTGSFAVTLALAVVTFGTGMLCGMKRFGFFGFWKNQIPSMHLPPAILFTLGLVVIPMLFVIEVVGLFIKHGVLGIRLLANMVAGHLVLFGIMNIAFGGEAIVATTSWWMTAAIVVVGATLFTCLELFVAFLQAYVFSLLSALFIGQAVHHH